MLHAKRYQMFGSLRRPSQPRHSRKSHTGIINQPALGFLGFPQRPSSLPFAYNPCPDRNEHHLPHSTHHVNKLLFEGGGGGGGFLARDGGGGGGPLIFAPAVLPCDVAGETEDSP